MGPTAAAAGSSGPNGPNGPTGRTGPTGRAGRIDGVLFDIDDTLVDTRGAFRLALAATSATFLPDLPRSRYDEVLTLWRADPNGYYRRYSGGTLGFVEQRMARANELQAQFGGRELDRPAFDAWDAEFEDGFRDSWAAHGDAAGVVGHLAAAGVAVGALSNAPVDYQSAKLGRVGLADAVPMLVGTDTLGVGKPDPAVFLEACRRLGTEPARTAYVGDELDIDALAAQRAGLVGIWLDRPGSRRFPIADAEIAAAGVLVIAGLDELPAALGL